MKQISCILFLSSIFSMQTLAQVYTAKSGSASFFSESSIENIDATSTNVQSILNTSAKSVALIIPMRSFHFKKDLMEEHFNEKYVESDKYPNATYSGKINENLDFSKDTTCSITSTGKIAMHGAEKEMTAPGTFTVKNGEATLESNFNLAVKDFNIEIPKLLFKNIADTVAVKINVIYQPYKK